MECNYEPYIQITGTTSFPRLRSSLFTKRRQLESLFQQERSDENLFRNPWRRNFQEYGERENAVEGRAGGGGGNSCQTMMPPTEAASKAFHERYSHLTPSAFCVSGPDGSKSLCLNQKEYRAIVERSRNKNSDCVFLLRPASRCSGNLDDEVCTARASSTCECRCRRTWNRPRSPVYKPDCNCRAGKPPRANACAMKGVHLRTNKKRCSTCLRGSCGKPLNCSLYENPSRPTGWSSKPCGSRLRSIKYSCRSSNINPGSCFCCCSSDDCHRMTSSCARTRRSSRCKDGCIATTGDSTRSRFTGCSSQIPRRGQSNCDNLLPPIYCTDPCRTRLRPVNLEACNGGKPVCGYNVYEVTCRPSDCTSRHNCPLDKEKFHLSAM